ncbi:ABC transporter substrate-binding protein [Nesterenkonia sphaerica]|uniref:ABC transporter substrate-binding protein n=1 Tax=Nesterenkonia sphaerica TaxID=1804988 RepID=A0A5R9AFU6_9MICC|nr:ABC transporter substrate-binding protein [Nesterenkonia sphaerica]TLP77448.1 ABC transporter substrate-binding protein [Nesterenkonia sphaerica]
MQRLIRAGTPLTAVLAVGALTLSACGAGGDDAGTTDQDGTEATGTGEAPDANVSIGMFAVPANLDFTTTGGAAVFEALLYNVYEGLVRLDEDGEIQPLLAESWDISDDGQEYTFHLQEGVTFHDGTAFDAEIVKFSLERLDQWSANTPEALDAIESVEVVDDYEVTVALSEPDYNALFWLAGPLGAMFSPDSVEDLATEANGTGPFEFVSYENAVRMEFARNEDYWAEPAGVAGVELVYYEDASAAANAIRTGGVDAVLRSEAFDQFESFEADEDIEVRVGTSQGVVVMSMNPDHEALAQDEVREAIHHAIDKEAVLAAATAGYGEILGGPSVPTDPYYSDFTGTYAYDPETAQELLEEAEVEALTFNVPNRAYAEASAQVIQDNLREVGIDVTLETQEFPAVWVEENMVNQDFDLTIINHVEPRNMNNYAFPDYYWGYDSDAARELFDEAAAATDDEEYASRMQELTELIVEDTPGVWLYNPPNVGLATEGVSGLPLNDLGVGIDLSNVTVSE